MIRQAKDRRSGRILDAEVKTLGIPLDCATLREEDKGRSVVYIPSAGNPELGTIVRWTDQTIFARFSGGDTASGCDPATLELVV